MRWLACNPEFLLDLQSESGGLLVWQDFTKLGKLSSKELNTFADILYNALRQRPTMSAGLLMCPVLVSEKVSSTYRGEIRRIEDKLDTKGLSNFLVTVRMDLPPTLKKVPIIFHGWLVVDQATESENVFMSSQLAFDRLDAAIWVSWFAGFKTLPNKGPMNWNILAMTSCNNAEPVLGKF